MFALAAEATRLEARAFNTEGWIKRALRPVKELNANYQGRPNIVPGFNGLFVKVYE